MDVKNKTIIVTGGNSGIGLAAAELFASQGANITIIGRREARNTEALEKIKATGAACLALSGDVTDESFMKNAIAKTVDTFGGLHFAFNNAGVEQAFTPLPEQSIEDFRKIIDVNLLGVWLAMREEIPQIIKSGGGCVVNTSSIAGHIAMAQIPLYVAAKHAVIGLTKATALEYAKENVRVNAVCPGAVKTEMYERFTGNDPEMDAAINAMHPMGRSGTSDEVASAVLYLCRDATWTTGQSLIMDGGFTAQ